MPVIHHLPCPTIGALSHLLWPADQVRSACVPCKKALDRRFLILDVRLAFDVHSGIQGTSRALPHEDVAAIFLPVGRVINRQSNLLLRRPICIVHEIRFGAMCSGALACGSSVGTSGLEFIRCMSSALENPVVRRANVGSVCRRL